MSSQTAAAMAWRVCAGLACSCSQPCSARNCWDAAASPRRSRSRACRSAGSTWRRFTVSRAEGMQPGGGERSRCGRPIPPGPTGWDWRGSPSTHSCPPGQASTAARTASTSPVGVWEISSSTTTVPAASGPFGQVDAQPGDRAGVQTGAGQLGHRLGRGGHRHHRPALGGGGLGGGVQHGRLAVTGRGEHRRRLPPSPVSTRPPPPDRRPGPARPPARPPPPPALMAGAGRAARVSTRARVRSSRARCAAVDHCGGLAPAGLVVGGQPHRQIRGRGTGRPWR